MRRSTARVVLLLALAGSAGPLALPPFVVAQQIHFGDQAGDRTPGKKTHVLLLTDAVEVSAGTPQVVELRFRVEPGFHINSHTPKDELLLPTALKLEASDALKAFVEQYPAGTAFRLDVGNGETLNVYQNEFRVRVRVTASRGASTLAGTLQYQACDSSACFPPRTMPVKVQVTAK